mmetsp:Transcript_2558/g.7250  ORF Transcript_2558/g.7250 Transcript_2558/m.7250 type:complete len:217 (+) Transcript_2558:120-770(+)
MGSLSDRGTCDRRQHFLLAPPRLLVWFVALVVLGVTTGWLLAETRHEESAAQIVKPKVLQNQEASRKCERGDLYLSLTRLSARKHGTRNAISSSRLLREASPGALEVKTSNNSQPFTVKQLVELVAKCRGASTWLIEISFPLAKYTWWSRSGPATPCKGVAAHQPHSKHGGSSQPMGRRHLNRHPLQREIGQGQADIDSRRHPAARRPCGPLRGCG